jgi:hypothetical protein
MPLRCLVATHQLGVADPYLGTSFAQRLVTSGYDTDSPTLANKKFCRFCIYFSRPSRKRGGNLVHAAIRVPTTITSTRYTPPSGSMAIPAVAAETSGRDPDRGRDAYYYAPPAQSRYVRLSRIRLPPRVFDGKPAIDGLPYAAQRV